MKEPNREQEQQIMAQIRAMLNDQAVMTRMAELAEQHVSPDTKVAMQGAYFDAIAQFSSANAPQRIQVMNKDLHVYFVAGVTRCLLNHCVHVARDFSLVKCLILGARLMSCKPCLAGYAPELQRREETRSDADECDLCLKRGVTRFYNFQVVWNGCHITGDACVDCRMLLQQHKP